MGTEGHNRRVIAGRYRLEEKLGHGGMGVVWRATDQLLGRSVAVKELPYDETLSAAQARRQRDRTLREARAVAQLSHPHIIVVHDVVEDGERPYIVMELIAGGSLADRLAQRGPVDAAEAARIGIALLGALGAAHAAGVLHRDLKPDNVLLETGTDRVVLSDFGIAQVAGAPTLTENGAFVGSPEYTAPERMSGVRTGPESDLWSLGALLCAALSGESPFHRDSLGGILHAVVVGDIQPPAQAGPLMPVVRGLLERDPDRRLDADRAERMLQAFRDTGVTPPAPPAGSGSSPGYAAAGDVPRRPPQDPVGGQPPGPPAALPGPDRPEEPFLRQPARRVLIAALLVAAVAGAGVSAAALLREEGTGDGGPTPTSSATTKPKTPKTAKPGTAMPKTPPPRSASPGTPAPAP
ncbi:serine/threonine-protein kinase [Streptomyces sp. SID5643]|uniref:serine/threonine-protein kinase n=1 Tax=Streptomyces sp. SID5643 TaxID=2690307 RepID=UPI00136EB19A|nr:serine/threonine-protein kinase [Streptomyces sp. SID5643]MZF89924.1 protein kinase [Streptomyces sp. SID5643]